MSHVRSWFLPGIVALVACTSDQLATTRPPAGHLNLLPSAVELLQGERLQLTAVVRSDADTLVPGAAIAWASSQPAVATVDSVGSVTGIVPGAVTIAARYGGQLLTRNLTVLSNLPRSMDVTAQASSLKVGVRLSLVAHVRAAEGLEISAPGVSWQSGAPQIATVDANGVVFGVSPGSATIVARSGPARASYTLRVLSITPQSVQLVSSFDTLLIDGTTQLRATVIATDGLPLDTPVTWSVDNGAATVSDAGLVRGVAGGTVTVTVRAGPVTATRSLVVRPFARYYTSIVIPRPDNLLVGETERLGYGGTESPGSGILESAPIISSDTSIVRVGPFGSLTAVSPGTVTLQVAGYVASATTTATVFPPATVPAVPQVQSVSIAVWKSDSLHWFMPTVTIAEASGQAGFRLNAVRITLDAVAQVAAGDLSQRVDAGGSRALWVGYDEGPAVDVPVGVWPSQMTLEFDYTDDAGIRGTVTKSVPITPGR